MVRTKRTLSGGVKPGLKSVGIPLIIPVEGGGYAIIVSRPGPKCLRGRYFLPNGRRSACTKHGIGCFSSVEQPHTDQYKRDQKESGVPPEDVAESLREVREALETILLPDIESIGFDPYIFIAANVIMDFIRHDILIYNPLTRTLIETPGRGGFEKLYKKIAFIRAIGAQIYAKNLKPDHVSVPEYITIDQDIINL